VFRCSKCDGLFSPLGGKYEAPEEPPLSDPELVPSFDLPAEVDETPSPSGPLPISSVLGISALITAGVSFLMLWLPCFWFLALPLGGLAFMLGLVGIFVLRKNRALYPVLGTVAGALTTAVSAALVYWAQSKLLDATQKREEIGRELKQLR
jgi:hypothetical protein